MADNLNIFDFELTDDEMARINALPQRPYYEVPEEPPAFVLTVNDYSKQATSGPRSPMRPDGE